MTEREAYIAFSVFPGIGPVRFRLLCSYFGNAVAAWSASESELTETGLGSGLVSAFVSFRSAFSVNEYLDRMHERHIIALTLMDEHYPKLLREIPDPPFVLYVRSGMHDRHIDLDRTIAVVGTRNPSVYGKEMTKTICRTLSANGCTIVSGMAFGVDAAAHETSLEMGVPTIAVLGCGVDIAAPQGNNHIYQALAYGQGGAVVSEMPLSVRPNKRLFPVRNRIISGLALGTVVMEGTDRSGSLITASYALTQGREVFAVPGAVSNPNSRAPFRLIRDGATPVESGEDILQSLGISPARERFRAAVESDDRLTTEPEKRIMACLNDGMLHADELVRRTNLSASIVFSALTVLELKGIIRDVGGKMYDRT